MTGRAGTSSEERRFVGDRRSSRARPTSSSGSTLRGYRSREDEGGRIVTGETCSHTGEQAVSKVVKEVVGASRKELDLTQLGKARAAIVDVES